MPVAEGEGPVGGYEALNCQNPCMKSCKQRGAVGNKSLYHKKAGGDTPS